MRAWCEAAGMRVVIYRASEMDREAWLRAIRDTDAAVVSRLDIIVSPKRQWQGRPSHEFARVLDHLRSRAALVVDIWHSARSDDAKSWDNALAAALRRVSSGRKALPRGDARRMQAASVAVRRDRSVLAKWRGLKERGAKEYKLARAVWKSREYANAAEAHAALPDELQAVSRVSLDRLFGGRTK